MKRQYLRQGTVAVNWLQLYELDFASILASDATDELTKVSTQLLYGDFRSLSDPQYHAYCYAALQALQMYGQYLAGIYHEQAEKLTEAQNFYLKAEAAPEALKKRLEEYQTENKHLKEVIRNITQMNAALMKKFVDLKDKFNSIVPLLQMLPKCRCGKTFISKDTLLHHMQVSHPHWPIPPEYEEWRSTSFQRPERSSSTRKRLAKKRLAKSASDYQETDSGSISDASDESSDPDLSPNKRARSSQRNSKRSKRHTHQPLSPVPRSRSSNTNNFVHATNSGHIYEPPRSYSSYVPQSQTLNTRPNQFSTHAIPHAAPKDSGQVQYILPQDAPSKQVSIADPTLNNLKTAEIEALVERAIARSLSAHHTAFQPAGYPADDKQRSAPIPPVSVVSSYGPPYLGNQLGEQQTLVYQPEDYEICPTSKTELKSPIGFRQADEPIISMVETAPSAGTNTVKPPPYAPVPNYVSSQLGSESLPSLHEKNSFPGHENVPPQYQAETLSTTIPANPTILQATAPVVTSHPSAVFVQPPDNILSPLHVKPQVEQPTQGSQPPAPAAISQISRESTLFAEDPEPQPAVSAAEHASRINDALAEHVRENWPELFQKPGSLPYNLDLTEPEILRRISVLNRSINNAVAANNLAHSSISGYHSSLSTYEEYGSTINDFSHRS